MTLDELSEAVGVRFPAGSRVVGVERQHGIDDLLRARVAVGREKVAEFEAGSPVSRQYMEDDAGALLGQGPTWWVPSPSARVGQTQLADGRVLHIGIGDKGEQGLVDVYVVNHGT